MTVAGILQIFYNVVIDVRDLRRMHTGANDFVSNVRENPNLMQGLSVEEKTVLEEYVESSFTYVVLELVFIFFATCHIALFIDVIVRLLDREKNPHIGLFESVFAAMLLFAGLGVKIYLTSSKGGVKFYLAVVITALAFIVWGIAFVIFYVAHKKAILLPDVENQAAQYVKHSQKNATFMSSSSNLLPIKGGKLIVTRKILWFSVILSVISLLVMAFTAYSFNDLFSFYKVAAIAEKAEELADLVPQRDMTVRVLILIFSGLLALNVLVYCINRCETGAELHIGYWRAVKALLIMAMLSILGLTTIGLSTFFGMEMVLLDIGFVLMWVVSYSDPIRQSLNLHSQTIKSEALELKKFHIIKNNERPIGANMNAPHSLPDRPSLQEALRYIVKNFRDFIANYIPEADELEDIEMGSVPPTGNTSAQHLVSDAASMGDASRPHTAGTSLSKDKPPALPELSFDYACCVSPIKFCFRKAPISYNKYACVIKAPCF